MTHWLFFLLLFAGLASATTSSILDIATPGGKDSYLDNSTPYANYGSAQTFTMGHNSTATKIYLRNALVNFNASNMTPYHVVGANMSLYLVSVLGSINCTNLTVLFTNSTRNWNETNATWFRYNQTGNWTTPGGDFASGGGANSPATIPNSSIRAFYNWSLFPTYVEYMRDYQTATGNFTGMISTLAWTTTNPPQFRNCSFNFASKENIAFTTHPYVRVLQNSPPNFTAYGMNNSSPIPDETVMINVTTGDDESPPLGMFTTVFSWTGGGTCDGSTYSNDSLVVQMWLTLPKNVSTVKTIPSICEGKPIRYKQYATDPRGDMNVSAEQTFYVQNVSPVVGNSFVNVSSTYRNTQVCANSSVTDVGVGVDKVYANVTFPNGTVVYRMYMTTTPKGDCGGGGSIYSMFVSVGSTVGNVTIQNITANDTLGNVGTNTTQRNVTVLNTPPVFRGSSTVPPCPFNYTTGAWDLRANWDDDAGVNTSILTLNSVNYSMPLYTGSNLSGTYRKAFTGIAAGTYEYNFSSSDGDGAYTFPASSNVCTISPTDPLCRMLLNGTEANRTYDVSSSSNNTINATGYCVGTANLYENTTLVNTSTNWVNWNRNVTTEQNGTCFNYTVAVGPTQNYSSSHATWWACVNDITPPPSPSAHGRASVFVQEDEDNHRWLWFVPNEQWPAVLAVAVIVLALLVGGAIYGRRKAG